MTPPDRALVRRPPRSYRAYYAARGVAVDLALADRQHAAYVAALESAGLVVEHVAPDETLADGVFIEDTVVVWKNQALVTRMIGRREGEQTAVLRHLRATHDIVTLPRHARLEGGDVLHTDDATYVGLSARTNQRGADALRAMLALSKRRVVAVPVERCLHLKSAATYLGSGHLLASREWIDVGRFDVDQVIDTAAGESKAANAIRIANHLLTLDGYPATARRIQAFAARMGLTVHPLWMSEFEKGDGSLTCLSIVVPGRRGRGVHPDGRRASSIARKNPTSAPIRRSTTMASMAKSAAKAVREAAIAMEEAKSALEHAKTSFKESRSAAAKGSAKAKAAIKDTVDKVTGRAKKRRRVKVVAATGLAAAAVAGGVMLARSRAKKNSKKKK